MNTPDLSTYTAEELLALITSANERLRQLREQHIAEGQKLGLAYVDQNGAPKRKRRSSKHQEQA